MVSDRHVFAGFRAGFPRGVLGLIDRIRQFSVIVIRNHHDFVKRNHFVTEM